VTRVEFYFKNLQCPHVPQPFYYLKEHVKLEIVFPVKPIYPEYSHQEPNKLGHISNKFGTCDLSKYQ
jgi:hypothetical protein